MTNFNSMSQRPDSEKNGPAAAVTSTVKASCNCHSSELDEMRIVNVNNAANAVKHKMIFDGSRLNSQKSSANTTIRIFEYEEAKKNVMTTRAAQATKLQ